MSTAVFVDYAESVPRMQRQLDDGDVTFTSAPVARDFFGRGKASPSQVRMPADHVDPEAFLIEFPVHSRTGAHFHSCDQFQIFFPANGAWYKSRSIDQIVVHYVDAYTTYGPFGTGDEPMIYYTLRAQPSTITGFMPGARDRWIRAGNRRNITADVDLSGARTAVSGDPLVQDVIGAHPDGLATRLIVAPGRARFMAPACPPRSIGQYVCVIDGTVQRDGRSLGSLSLGWQSAGTEVAVTAGPDGCAVLTVAFPEYVDVAACAAAKDG